jgi:hypothetical protein
MTLREKQTEFWSMVARLINRATVLGTPIFIAEWMRTWEQQTVLVARKASKTMNSKHLQGLAVDVIFLADVQDDSAVNYTADAYRSLGEFWEEMGGRWGGRFGDNPDTDKVEGWDAGHFEYKD